MGPRNGVFLRLAKTRPVEDEDDGAGKADSLYVFCCCGRPRTRRMLEGKVLAVGVDGRTLTDVCGERPVRMLDALLWAEGKADECTELEVDEVDEALEWVCTWWMLRTELTDDEVDLRPRRPMVPVEEWR